MKLKVADASDLEILQAVHPDTRRGLPFHVCAKIDAVVEDLNPHYVYTGEVYNPWDTARAIRVVLEYEGVEELEI